MKPLPLLMRVLGCLLLGSADAWSQRPGTSGSATAGAAQCSASPAGPQTTEPIFDRAEKALVIDTLRATLANSNQQADYDAALRAADVGDSVRLFVADPLANWSRAPSLKLLAAVERAVRDKLPPGGPNVAFGVPGGEQLFGLPSQMALLLGLTDFLLERAKDELVLAYVEDLRRTLLGDTLVTSLMPNSWAILQNMEAASYKTLLPTFRAATVQDFDELPGRLGDTTVVQNILAELVPDPARRAAMFAQRIPYIKALSLSLASLQEIRGGAHPSGVLARYAALSQCDMPNDTLRHVFRVVGIGTREHYGSGGRFATALQRPTFTRFFAGFFVFDETKPGGLLANRTGAQVAEYVIAKHADVALLVRQVEELNTLVRTMRTNLQRENPPALAEAYAPVFRSATQLLTTGSRLLPPDISGGRVPQVLAFAGSASDLFSQVMAKEYGRAVVTVVRLIEANAADLSRDQMRYLGLAANLATAQRAEEVTAALEAGAAPISTYRAKRGGRTAFARRWSFTVNGYVGGSYGSEEARIPGRGSNDGAVVGVAVPVGLELAYAFRHSSLSLFVPLIDVGTLASFRLTGDDQIESEPEVGFKQVFAPGVFGVLGISESKPISIAVGYQRVPELRAVKDLTTGGATGEKVDVRRLTLWVAVDVPIFRF
jgi:hypothetical protein